MGTDTLRRAIDGGDVEELRRLLADDRSLANATITWDGNDSDPLHYLSDAPFHGLACHDRFDDMARVLIEAGASVEGPPNAGETPLIAAASLGRADVARVLIEAGANLEKTGVAVADGTALSHAVQFGSPEVVDVLVEAGAKVRTLKEAAGVGDVSGLLSSDSPESERAEALGAASVCQRLEVIDELLATGLAIDTEVEGSTALHAAAREGKPEAVRHLLDYGANLDRHDRHNNSTPLGWCRYRHSELGKSPGHDAAEQTLVERGAG